MAGAEATESAAPAEWARGQSPEATGVNEHALFAARRALGAEGATWCGGDAYCGTTGRTVRRQDAGVAARVTRTAVTIRRLW